MRNVPGFIPFETLPQDAKSQPEIFGSLAATYYLPGRCTSRPGIARRRAAARAPSRASSPRAASRRREPSSSASQGDESILPYDQGRLPIFQGRVSLRWDLSRIMSAIGWLQYIRDPNGTLVVVDPTEGTASLRVPQAGGPARRRGQPPGAVLSAIARPASRPP